MTEKCAKKICLEERDFWKICGCLFNEAWKWKELAEDYKKEGLQGLSGSAWAEGVSLMRISDSIKRQLKEPVSFLAGKEAWSVKKTGKRILKKNLMRTVKIG